MCDVKVYKSNINGKNKENDLVDAKKRHEASKERISIKRKEQRVTESAEVKAVRSVYMKKYREEHKDSQRQKNLSDEYVYKYWYKGRASKRGYSFELTEEYFLTLFHSPCTYCGKDDARGVDRVINSVGYIKTNSVPCCGLCNKMKWSHNRDIFLEQCRRVAEHNVV